MSEMCGREVTGFRGGKGLSRAAHGIIVRAELPIISSQGQAALTPIQAGSGVDAGVSSDATTIDIGNGGASAVAMAVDHSTGTIIDGGVYIVIAPCGICAPVAAVGGDARVAFDTTAPLDFVGRSAAIAVAVQGGAGPVVVGDGGIVVAIAGI